MDVNSRVLEPRGLEKVAKLIDRGVRIPNPLTVDIDEAVDIDNISSDGVVIGPGCRIRGRRTVISAGCILGDEAPMTIQDCQLGTGVKLKGGFAQDAVFLDGASMGSGAHVRGGTILEEEANGAHTVGLKQTILMPFVTLGSLINFCDVLLAGGTRGHTILRSVLPTFISTSLPTGIRRQPPFSAMCRAGCCSTVIRSSLVVRAVPSGP